MQELVANSEQIWKSPGEAVAEIFSGNILQSPRMVFKDNFFLNIMDKLESSS